MDKSKMDKSQINYIKKNITKESVVKELAINENILKGIATVELIDRQGDIVRVDGISLKYHNDKTSIKVLANHVAYNTTGEPTVIGKVLELNKTTINVDGVDCKALEFTMEFADTELAREYKSLIDGGFLDSFSIGFEGVGTPIVDEEGYMTGIDWYETSLLEISIVSFPANIHATVVKSINDNKHNNKQNDEVVNKKQDINTLISDNIVNINTKLNNISQMLKDIANITNNNSIDISTLKNDVNNINVEKKELEKRVDIIDATIENDDIVKAASHDSKQQQGKDDLLDKLSEVLKNYKRK